MIVPSDKLVRWAAIVLVPFALLGALEPAALPWALLVIGLFIAIVLSDAWRSRSVLMGISLVLPEVARLTEGRPAKLELRVRNESRSAKALRLGLALPSEIQSSQEETIVALPAEAEWSSFSWPCMARKRGSFPLEAASVESSSTFGFWNVRKTLPARSVIRVYPNLSAERRDLAALFLHRGWAGAHAQRQVGKGRDFEKLREYIPGDGYDEIHWKATARRGKPITKVFQIERTQEIYVILDASRLSARPGGREHRQVAELNRLNELIKLNEEPGEQPPCSAATCRRFNSARHVAQSQSADMSAHSKSDFLAPTCLDRFITAALVLGLAAEQQGDLFGILTFTHRVESFVRARNGKVHYSHCRDRLYALKTQMVSPDFEELFTFIRLRLRRRALLVFLTALDDPVVAESFVKNISLIRRQHLVLVNMLEPPGVKPLFSEPNTSSVDDLYERLGGHLLWRNLRELGKVLQRSGVTFSLLKNERLSADLVSQYLNVKRRQIL